MRDAVKTSLVSFSSALVAVGGYHFARGTPGDSSLDTDRLTMETEVAGLRKDFDRFRKQLTADLDARFRAHAKQAGANGTPASPGSVPGNASGADRPTPYSESARLTEFRSLLEEIEKRRARERDEATWRRRLKNASISLPIEREDEFVATASAYQESVRDLFPGGSGGDTVEAREATLMKLEELRGALLEKIRTRFEGSGAEDLEKMFPPAPTAPIERAGPSDPGAMGR